MTTAASTPVSFLTALKARYSAEDDSQNYSPDAFLVGDPKRRRNKTWDFVGMEQTREKQSRFDKLVCVVLRAAGITVAVSAEEVNSAAEGGDALAAAHMARLRELDLSENTGLPFAELVKLLTYFAQLQTLQVSSVPSLLPSAPPDASPLHATHLRKLVFNNIGFRSLYHLRTLLDLPALQELHLDNNDIEALALYDDDDKASQQAQAAANAAARDGGRWLCWPHITTLSLAHNKLTSWSMCSAVESCFPSLTQLTLTDNQLPNIVPLAPEGAEVCAAAAASREGGEAALTCADPQLRYLQHLTVLNVSDNQTITDPCTIDALRVLCPRLEALRLSYEPIFPNWRDALSRMYVVAALPTITILNRGPVRPKERLDSEVFYIQRGLAARERGAPPEGSAAPQEPTYPLLDHLQHIHRDLVLSTYRAGSSASQDGSSHLMLTVLFVCQDHRKRADGNTRSATIPSSLTVARLKALVKNLFRIDPAHQVLSYRSGDAAVLERPVELDAEQQTLAYYGVPNGARIEVVDNSLQY